MTQSKIRPSTYEPVNFDMKLLDYMTQSEQEQALAYFEALTKIEAKDHLRVFAGRNGYTPAKHHQLLIDHLEALERREIQNLLVITPPGAAKSTYSSILFPAWYLGRNPKHMVLATSNTMELAERFGRKVRGLVAAADFGEIFGNVGLSEESAAAARWETTQGGEFFAVGVGGSIVGRRGDCLLGNTEIQAYTGVIKLSQVKVGDYVLSIQPDGRQSYRRVLAVKQRQTDEFLRIRTHSGRVVEATGNHRIYVNGDFRKAETIVAGNVLLRTLRQGEHPPVLRGCGEDQEQQRHTADLQREVRVGVEREGEVDGQLGPYLRVLRERILTDGEGAQPFSQPDTEREGGVRGGLRSQAERAETQDTDGEVQLRVLREGSRTSQVRTEQETSEEPRVQTGVQPVMCNAAEQCGEGDAPGTDVQQLWQGDVRPARTWCQGVFRGVPQSDCEEGSAEAGKRHSDEDVRVLREGVQTRNVDIKGAVLLDGVQEHRTCEGYGGETEPDVPARSVVQQVRERGSAQVQGCEDEDIRSGQSQVRGVRIGGEDQRAPHRLEPEEQRFGKFGVAVPRVPCGLARGGEEQTEPDVVSLVERVHERADVFDIQVEGSENFFANGILVHNCLLMDDVVRSKEDVESEQLRNKVWDWYVADVVTRLKPNAVKLFVNTRWHEDDLAGRILEREADKWTVLHMEMENTREDDPLGRAIGERLWPEWFTQEMVDEAKQDVGTWNALYQGRPSPDGGGEFKKDWVEYYDSPPDRKRVTTLMLVDPANSKTKKSDYTAIWVLGVGGDDNFYVLDIVRDRLDLAERIELVFRLHRKWKPVETRYERFGLQTEIDYLKIEMDRRSYRFKIREVAGVKISKEDRIRRLIPYFKDGRIVFPREFIYTDHTGKPRDLVKYFIDEEYAPFPVAKWDDCNTFDTLIECKQGQVKIGLLQDGDCVLTYTGNEVVEGVVSNHHCTGVKEILVLEFEDGLVLETTPAHPILTERGYVYAGDLTSSDNIVRKSLCKYRHSAANGHKPKADTTSQRQALMAKMLGFIGSHTSNLLAQSRNVARYITETVIRTTMQLTTWSAYHQQSTDTGTGMRASPLGVRQSILSIFPGFATLPLKRRKGAMLDCERLGGTPLGSGYASTAEWSSLSSQQTSTEQSIVQSSVSGKAGTCFPMKSTRSQNLVFSVARCLRQIATLLRTRSFAQTVVSTSTGMRTSSSRGLAKAAERLCNFAKGMLLGIVKSARSQARTCTNESASHAGKRFLPQELTAKHGAIDSVLTTPEDLSVIQNAMNDTNRQFVRAVSARMGRPQKTYNFDVAGTRNYLIESGIVVHNCIDSLSRLAEPGLVLPKHVTEEEKKEMFMLAETEFVPLDPVLGY